MKMIGIDGLSMAQLDDELEMGGKFVVYQYCISIVIMTFRRNSNIHFVRSGESAFSKGLPYTLLSVLLGWWGIPWGPIYTIGAIVTNCRGGKDVTEETRQLFEESEA